MNLIDFSIRNPVKVAVGVILTVMFGALAFLRTPVQLTPEIAEPEATVTTLWPGASAQEVEREIVEEQEEQLKSIEGLREFKSESSDSAGRITLKFEVGTPLSDIRVRINDKLNQVPQYPVDAREPTVTTGSTNANFIAWFILKPLPPTAAEVRAFMEQHPDTKADLEPLLSDLQSNDEVSLSSLAKFADQHPQLDTFLHGKDDPTRMRKFAEQVIEARFERVEGVSNANVFGGREEECRIIVDPAKLAAHRLTIGDLRRALQSQNKNTSGGDIWEGQWRNVVRTLAQFGSVERVSQAIIAKRDNTPIRVRDVAEVRIDYKKPDGVVRNRGLDALAINAEQTPGSNVLKIMGPERADLDLNRDGEISVLELAEAKLKHGDCLRIAAEELNQGFLKQKGLRLEQVYDQTEYIHSATELVQDNMIWGTLLTLAVLLAFLRQWRPTLVIGLSIPISVIGAFVFVRAFGRSINVVSLAGMAFAVGMVVDNAIVVLENIYRHYQMGKDRLAATIDGTNEVWGAVLASTLTTVAVFVPVIFQQGQTGQLFKDISIAISCGVGLSMLVSITVVPTLARWLLREQDAAWAADSSEASSNKSDAPQRDSGNGRQNLNPSPARPARAPGDNFLRRLFQNLFGIVPLCSWGNELFTAALRRLLSGRGLMAIGLRTLVVLAFVVGSLGGTWLLMPKTEYLPEGNRNLIIAIMLPPAGYNVDQMIEIGKRIESDLAPYWEAKPGSPEEAQLKGPRLDNFFFVARGRSLFMGAKSADALRAGQLIPVMRAAAAKIPGMIPIVKQASLFESGLGGGRTIDVEITGPNLETLVAEGQKIMELCLQLFPMEHGNQLRPVPSLDLSSPELHVVPRAEKAAELGVTAVDLGYAVDALVDGAYAGDYWHNGQKIDLVIHGADEYSRHTHDVENLPLNTPAGKLVTLGAVADVRLGSGPEQVNHIERLRAITIQLTPAKGIPLESALQTINDKVRLPMLHTPTFEGGQYQIRLAGTADKLDQARRDMQWDLLLAMIITYLLLAALFESFFYPVVIMTSIALALVGGFAGLRLLDLFVPQTLDMLTMLGFVILIGTVVNNAILVVHQSLNFMHDGWEERAAIVESVRSRMRPIFMTTLTTVLGMLPLVVRPGAGSELYRGLGSVVLGGLLVSTIFTLVLVPVAFSLSLDLKRALSRQKPVDERLSAGEPVSDKVVPAGEALQLARPQ